MIWTRRKFLRVGAGATCLAGTGAGLWVARSRRRSAKMLRQFVRDARRDIIPAPVVPEPLKWPSNGIRLCWLGHASVLINFYGLHILTDPVFSRRVGINAGLGTIGPKRFVAPALTRDQLPPIDVVVLSHAHMDHMDLPSLHGFPGSPAGVTAKDTRDLLGGTPFEGATELAWGEKTVVRCSRGDLQVEALEVKHWGRRWPSNKDRGYNGYVLTREGRSIVFGGDTAFTPLFARLRERGPFGVAIMPVAAYDPWIRNHCTPEEAVTMANLMGAERIVPVHHQTFKLSDEPMEEPIERFVQALEHEPSRIGWRQIGGTCAVV